MRELSARITLVAPASVLYALGLSVTTLLGVARQHFGYIFMLCVAGCLVLRRVPGEAARA